MTNFLYKTKTKPIDKIRSEIENLEEGITSYHNDRPWVYKDEVLQIIDKYKPEMEMKKASDIEVCEKIIMLAREVIKENGNHDIRLYARDSKGRVLK